VDNHITEDQIAGNPELEAYLRANFPQALNADYQPPVPPHVSKRNSFALPTDVTSDRANTHTNTHTNATEVSVSPRNIRPLVTYLRDPDTESNTRKSRFLRAQRWIPGILYGSDPTQGIYEHQGEASKLLCKTPWHLLERELGRYHRGVEGRVYALTVWEHEDAAEPLLPPQLVVPRNIQRHPVQSKLYCANFCRYHAGRPLKLPIRYVNQEESPALKRDGYILPIQRTIEVLVDFDNPSVSIPEAVELECTGLQFEEVIRKDRLVLPDGVRLSDRVLRRGDDYIVGVVDGRNREST
jgi:large subunit ribosomal protein L25